MKKKIEFITDQRPFTIVYNDFLESNLLNSDEKMVFIVLKKFTDDNNNYCFPSLKKLSEITGISKRKIQNILAELEKKGVIIKENRIKANGSKTSNLYTLFDFKELWTCNNIGEVEEVINKFEENQMIEVLSAKGYTITKKREPISKPAQVTDISTLENKFHKQDTTQEPKSQERYTLNQIKQLFEYDIMIQDNQHQRKDIDSVIDILYTTMNTTKETLRINGENKPSMVVIGKLMKLNKESIIYAISKFSERTNRINNSSAYMLTILYNAPEQFNLDLQNQVQYNMNTQIKDYNELERQLLG